MVSFAADDVHSRREHLKVYLVRHGESTNNVLAHKLETAYEKGTISLDDARWNSITPLQKAFFE